MAKILKQRTAGEPQPSKLRQNWPIRLGSFPIARKRSIRTLLKHDPAKDQRAEGNLTDQPGVITGDRGGFKGGVSVRRQQPNTPTATKSGIRTIRAASLGKLKRR